MNTPHTDLFVTTTDEDTGILTLNNPRAPKFKAFLAGLGWLDPQGEGIANQHALILGGIQIDDRLLILDECSGDISEIVSSAVRLKDQFLVSDIWADTTDVDAMTHLWVVDGLTRYHDLGNDPMGNIIWATHSSHWPHFRDRGNVARLMPIPKTMLTSNVVGLNRLVALTAAGKLLVHPRCPNVQWVFDQARPADVAQHPIYRAVSHLVYGYDRNNPQKVSDSLTNTSAQVYRNLKKGQ